MKLNYLQNELTECKNAYFCSCRRIHPFVCEWERLSRSSEIIHEKYLRYHVCIEDIPPKSSFYRRAFQKMFVFAHSLFIYLFIIQLHIYHYT